MEFKDGSDAGQNNTFNDAKLGDGSQYFHGDVNNLTIINGGKNAARISRDFGRLRNEIGKELDPRIKDAIKHYETKLPGTKDAEEKLTDGGFKPSRIKEAIRQKEYWAKEAFRTSNNIAIQEDNLVLYSRIVHEFEIYIMPMVEDGEPLRDIMTVLHEKIVAPIMNIFQEYGYTDDELRYNYDHIYGMIYYLTGNCHINWKDYDNDNVQPCI